MQLVGKLVQILPIQTGQGKNGEWKKQNIIMETEGQYPKKICVSLWGDKATDPNLVLGNMLKIDLDIESREYNGNWYNDIKGWKIENASASNSGSNSSPQNSAPIAPPDDFDTMSEDSGLPF